MKALKSIALFFIISLCISNQVHAQYYFFDEDYYDNDVLFEVGASINAMNSLTDLAGKNNGL